MTKTLASDDQLAEEPCLCSLLMFSPLKRFALKLLAQLWNMTVNNLLDAPNLSTVIDYLSRAKVVWSWDFRKHGVQNE